MRKIFFILAVAAVSLAPPAARAEPLLVLPVQQSAPTDSVDSSKLLVIGVGVVVGYALASTIWTIPGTTLLGAVAGGLIGNWWYQNHGADIAKLDKPRPG